MPRKNSREKRKTPAKKNGRNSRKQKEELLVPEKNLRSSGIITRQMSTRDLGPLLMAPKNINKLPLRKSKSRSRDPKKSVTSVKRESVSRRRAPTKMATVTDTNLSYVRKETIKKNPTKKSESQDIVAPLKAKLQKKLKEKKETKKLALAQKKKINKKQLKYEIKALDSNARKSIYSVEILPVKCTDLSHINPPGLLPVIKTCVDSSNDFQRLAPTVGKRETDDESGRNASTQAADSQMGSDELNSDCPENVLLNQGVKKKTRTAHCIHTTDSQAMREDVNEQLSDHNLPKISNEVQQQYRLGNNNVSDSVQMKSTVRQLKKGTQRREKLTTTLPEALASWLIDFLSDIRASKEEMIV